MLTESEINGTLPAYLWNLPKLSESVEQRASCVVFTAPISHYPRRLFQEKLSFAGNALTGTIAPAVGQLSEMGELYIRIVAAFAHIETNRALL